MKKTIFPHYTVPPALQTFAEFNGLEATVINKLTGEIKLRNKATDVVVLYWATSERALAWGKSIPSDPQASISPQSLAKALIAGEINRPVDAREDRCECGAPIFWVRVEHWRKFSSVNAYMVCDPDGMSHFATCPREHEYKGGGVFTNHPEILANEEDRTP